MGLDMYLSKRVKATEETSEAGYWRKSNQIHNWFVSNCQGGKDECQKTLIPKSKLEELLVICMQITNGTKLIEGTVANGYIFSNGEHKPILEEGKVILDSTLAEELLPTSSGFFFGGTEYDQWYVEDINNTIEILKEVLMKTDFDKEEVYYQSSW